MSRYIVDASVVVERLIQGPYTANARVLFNGALHEDQFSVPEMCLVECTNVIWKMIRFRGMPAVDAQTALRNLRALPLRRAATKTALAPALAIALKHELAVYDSLYIALALKTGDALVSIDAKQCRAAIVEGVVVQPITDFE